MSSMSALEVAKAIRLSISSARISTYENAARAVGRGLDEAITLYAWNALVSAAFLTPLHLCEVIVRNGVADAIASVYGPEWPWSPGFEQSLPNVTGPVFKPKQELARARQKCGTTGAVIAELKFVFWEKMFTKRFEGRIWAPYLYRFFPNLEKCFTVSAHRAKIAADLEQIRLLRNRIAHHEPIFSRNLRSDFAVIQRLTETRCAVSANWMNGQQQVMSTVATKPF